MSYKETHVLIQFLRYCIGGESQDEMEKFYYYLQQTIRHTTKGGHNHYNGRFVSGIGGKTPRRYGLVARNEMSDRLVQFCAEKEIKREIHFSNFIEEDCIPTNQSEVKHGIK